MTLRPYSLKSSRAKKKVVLLEGIHPVAKDVFLQGGYTTVETFAKALSGEELLDVIHDAHFVGIRSRTNLTEAVIRKAQKLDAIGCFCIGTSQVDLDAAMHHGAPVFNAPFSNTRSVAELVLAEVTMLLRGIAQKNAILHRGGWLKSASDSYEVRGKTLGIVGYGHIGTQVGVLAEQLGMKVIFHDIERKLALGNAKQVDGLNELLRSSHVVTLHVPETDLTNKLISAPQLNAMRPGGHLINASRGSVVDIDALCIALESKHLLGAAIDVFPVEPSGNDATFVSALTKFDNVILTPHIGGSTLEAQENIGGEVAAKLVRYGDNGSTTSAVNFPEVSLPDHARRVRLLHVHYNKPGVMAQINEKLSLRGVNVCSQYLSTRGALGYVAIDVDTEIPDQAMRELAEVPGTVSCRSI